MNRMLIICCALVALAPNVRAAEEDRGGFAPLFDGKSFSGWEGNLKAFRIEDGAIVGGSLAGPVPHNEYLCTSKPYGDFELRFRFKLAGENVNAGVQIRSERVPNSSEMIGYQADIGQKYWGCLYDERRHKLLAGPSPEEQRKFIRSNDWNDYRVLCEGRHVRFWLNGHPTVDYVEPDTSIPQVGVIGLQIHKGGPSEAWYRDIVIKELTPAKPNIVVILADDIGYGDLSCHGAKMVQTPNLDRLARDGRRFMDAHSPASTCTPTRRALLTGKYSWRQPEGSAIAPGDAAITIQPGTVTLPSMLKGAGYTTGIVGKWHLGLGPDGGPDWNGEIKPGPLELGFDYSFIMAATGDRVPTVFIENRRVVGLDPSDPIKVSYKEKVGSDPTGKENPELLKLRHTHGHDNTIVNGVGRIGWMTGGKSARWKDEDMADTFTKKAVSFIEGQKEKPFFLYFATHNIHVPRVPHPRHHGKSQCGTRGDAIVELDVAVGEVLATLDRLKLADKTLVVFTSDNGGVMDDGYEDVGNFEHPCNGALRGYKGSLFEGGHRVPFIARWPGKIEAGSRCAELIAHLDLLATFAALTGQALPSDAAPDSFNVLPALLGQPHDKPGRENFVAHVGGTKGPFTIRQGQWKLIQAGGARESYKDAGKTARAGKGKGKAAIPPFLVNLADDLGEKKNVATEHPDKVKELQALFEKLRDAGRSRP